MPWPFPRPYEYPYTWVVTGNTPDRWRDLLREAAALSPRALLLYAWNEWTEGGYLLPEERTGTAYLEAVREVFGVR
ncbi:MAG: glycoside hydrolase family 99-like domain-containing protein [Gammaproteobacteria bacterium]|nr:glycoside hydrolase family 99-like domain-containing protein [Gammaproteobacteria bacterium]